MSEIVRYTLEFLTKARMPIVMLVVGFLLIFLSFCDSIGSGEAWVSFREDLRLAVFVPGVIAVASAVFAILRRNSSMLGQSRVTESAAIATTPEGNAVQVFKQVIAIEDDIYWRLFLQSEAVPVRWNYGKAVEFSKHLHLPPVSHYIATADMSVEWGWWNKHGIEYVESQRDVLTKSEDGCKAERIFAWHPDMLKDALVTLYNALYSHIRLQEAGADIESYLVDRDGLIKSVIEGLVNKFERLRQLGRHQLTMIALYRKGQSEHHRLICYYTRFEGLVIPYLPADREEFDKIFQVLDEITGKRGVQVFKAGEEALRFVEKDLKDKGWLREAEKEDVRWKKAFG